MRVIILGSGGPLPDPERGGSAILISVAGRHYLFDCGQGATRQTVRANVDPAEVHTLFFSHLHFDHIADFPFFILSSWICNRGERPTVIGPRGTDAFVKHLFAGGAYAADIEARLQFRRRQTNRYAIEPNVVECEPGVIFADGVVTVTAVYVEHIPREISPCFALRLEAEGRALVFSGDTAPCEAVIKLAANADLLLHECTFPEQAIEFRKSAAIGTWSHTSPIELGKIAAKAGVKSLVATHFAPWETTHPLVKRHLAPHMPVDIVGPHLVDEVVADIRQNYAGELRLAEDLMRIDL
ncbi:MAG: MBL fold metallo-hydrolase [Candidatus Tectomicrobia bacterium]|nr:MBL fold metallo-hydrolase [Candidatus Tectomicrobia bacterium]